MQNELINCMEKIVVDEVERLDSRDQLMCGCDKCKLDITLRALNRLPPLYAIKRADAIYSEYQSLEKQIALDVLMQVVKASLQVGQNPSH